MCRVVVNESRVTAASGNVYAPRELESGLRACSMKGLALLFLLAQAAPNSSDQGGAFPASVF